MQTVVQCCRSRVGAQSSNENDAGRQEMPQFLPPPQGFCLRVPRDGTFNALVSVKRAHFPLTESGRAERQQDERVGKSASRKVSPHRQFQAPATGNFCRCGGASVCCMGCGTRRYGLSLRLMAGVFWACIGLTLKQTNGMNRLRPFCIGAGSSWAAAREWRGASCLWARGSGFAAVISRALMLASVPPRTSGRCFMSVGNSDQGHRVARGLFRQPIHNERWTTG